MSTAHDSSISPGLRVAELFVHPIKSARALRVEHAVVTPTGLRGDREFMIVNATGQFVSQREHPILTRLGATIGPRGLELSYEGTPPIEIPHATLESTSSARERECVVWGDRVAAVDLGDEAARLLTALLGAPARLVRMADGAERPVDPRFGRRGDRVSFADGFPVLVATSAAIERVSGALDRPVDARTFRPNIVVAGAEPFEEDTWKRIRVGSVELELVKPCARCVVVDVDPDRGERRGDVLAALATLRRARGKVFFGQNAIPRTVGAIAVGDAVHVLERVGAG